MISYYDAVSNNLAVYNDGKPCKQNHPNARYVKTNQCVYCSREAKKRSHEKIRIEKINNGTRTYIQVTVQIHREDHQALQIFVNQLNIDRQLTEAGL